MLGWGSLDLTSGILCKTDHGKCRCESRLRLTKGEGAVTAPRTLRKGTVSGTVLWGRGGGGCSCKRICSFQKLYHYYWKPMPLFGANCCSCSNENRMSFDVFEKRELLLIHLDQRI